MVYPCDYVIEKWGPSLNLAKLVDDVTIAVRGIGQDISQTVVEALDWFFNFLKHDLHFTVSLNK